jgi:hypothetical protein
MRLFPWLLFGGLGLVWLAGQLGAQTINPTILINNVTGANPPAASGAPAAFGPVIPGSLCATTGASTTIQSPGHGLGAVPTDGSAAVWMETASGRRWSKITGVPNGDTFTVQDSFNIGVAVACAVGGEIAGTLGNITRLCNDLKNGWTVILENTGTPYVDAGACVFAATNQVLAGNGRIVIRGDDPDNPTPIQYQTNGNYFSQSLTASTKLENLHLIKDTAAGTTGSISATGVSVVKNVRVSNTQGSWATAWGALQANPALVLGSEFLGPFTAGCASIDNDDLIVGNFMQGCSGSAAAISGGGALLFNIVDQAGANQILVSGAVNGGFGGLLLYNTLLNGGGSGIQLGTNFPTIVSGNLIGEASTLAGACFTGATGATNLLGGGGQAHVIWRGNAANVCPTARYAAGLDVSPSGAATDLDAGALFDPLFQDEGALDFFPTNALAKSNTLFPGITFPLLTPAQPISTMTAGAAQRPGGGSGAYAY